VRPSTAPPALPDTSLDELVGRAFAAWDECHRGLTPLRTEYDAAMHAHDHAGGADPIELRDKLRQAQADCDRLFFKLLRVAEDRTRDRYI
jgi:hypothetical protein